jgi:hypothetical protein
MTISVVDLEVTLSGRSRAEDSGESHSAQGLRLGAGHCAPVPAGLSRNRTLELKRALSRNGFGARGIRLIACLPQSHTDLLLHIFTTY